jgi:hypothetical protein
VSAPLAVVAGAIAGKLDKGGEAWVRLNWALGLRALGYDVRVVEVVDGEASLRAEAYFADALGTVGLDGLLVRDGESGHARALAELLAEADVLINVSGHVRLSQVRPRPRQAVYVDVDPVYTQCWAAQGHDVGLAGHDLFVTVGLALGRPTCDVPTLGRDWLAVPPPVCLAEWPAVPPPAGLRFTTVATWRGGYGRLEHGGTLYGQKAHEWRKLVDLPQRSRHPFEIALDIDPSDAADWAALADAGWRLVDPAVAAAPDSYRRYVQASGAELSVAQGAYVETQCGWISDRTAAYLASGRPGIVQDTGLGQAVPTGAGLLTFRTAEEAAARADEVAAAYEEHANAARRLAERRLDAARVVASVLDRLPQSSRRHAQLEAARR